MDGETLSKCNKSFQIIGNLSFARLSNRAISPPFSSAFFATRLDKYAGVHLNVFSQPVPFSAEFLHTIIAEWKNFEFMPAHHNFCNGTFSSFFRCGSKLWAFRADVPAVQGPRNPVELDTSWSSRLFQLSPRIRWNGQVLLHTRGLLGAVTWHAWLQEHPGKDSMTFPSIDKSNWLVIKQAFSLFDF